MKCKIMTFNLRREWALDGTNNWPLRQDSIIALIQQYQPDIIGTQEGYDVMLQQLAERLTEYGWVGTGRHGGHENEHNAIFYKKNLFTVVEQGTFWLSEHPTRPKSIAWGSSHSRICTWAQLRAEQETFFVYNTHLDYKSQLARENGLKLIVENIQAVMERFQLPVIVTGDFNAEPDHAIFDWLSAWNERRYGKSFLRNAYDLMQEPAGLTYHEFTGGTVGEPIDYILASSDVTISNVQIIRSQFHGKFPSDHYPVMADVSF